MVRSEKMGQKKEIVLTFAVTVEGTLKVTADGKYVTPPPINGRVVDVLAVVCPIQGRILVVLTDNTVYIVTMRNALRAWFISYAESDEETRRKKEASRAVGCTYSDIAWSSSNPHVDWNVRCLSSFLEDKKHCVLADSIGNRCTGIRLCLTNIQTPLLGVDFESIDGRRFVFVLNIFKAFDEEFEGEPFTIDSWEESEKCRYTGGNRAVTERGEHVKVSDDMSCYIDESGSFTLVRHGETRKVMPGTEFKVITSMNYLVFAISKDGDVYRLARRSGKLIPCGITGAVQVVGVTMFFTDDKSDDDE